MERTDLVAGADDPAVTLITVTAPVRFGDSATVVPAAPPAASSHTDRLPPLVTLAGPPAPVAAQPHSVAGAGARVPGPLTAPSHFLLTQTDIKTGGTSPVKLTGG